MANMKIDGDHSTPSCFQDLMVMKKTTRMAETTTTMMTPTMMMTTMMMKTTMTMTMTMTMMMMMMMATLNGKGRFWIAYLRHTCSHPFTRAFEKPNCNRTMATEASAAGVVDIFSRWLHYGSNVDRHRRLHRRRRRRRLRHSSSNH